jgi:hypothetical protein
MVDAPTIEFRSGPQYIRCELGRPYEEFPRYLPTAVMVDTGVFRGAFATDVWVDEWLGIRDALTGLNAQVGQDAEARCGFGEAAGVSLSIRLTRLGHLALRVEIRLNEVDSALQFWMYADQTYLPLWIQQIDEALAQLAVS